MQRLTNAALIEVARRHINDLFAAHVEWFFIAHRQAQSLRHNEFEVSTSHGRLVLSCWTDKGARSWRIDAWQWTGEKLLLQAVRRMGAEQLTIEMVPRASASAIAAPKSAAVQELSVPPNLPIGVRTAPVR